MITKRVCDRVPFYCDVRVAVRSGRRRLSACAVDLSRGGVGIMVAGAFQRGDAVEVTFLLKDARQKVFEERVWGRVAHFRAETEVNRIGVEFEEPDALKVCPEVSRRLNRI